MQLKPFLICIILYIFVFNSYSQADIVSFTIQGSITDSTTGEPLIGVSVLVKGMKTGAITDNKGMFLIKLKPGSYVLSVAYIGFVKKEFPLIINSNQNISIPISPIVTTLSEVTITSQRKFFGNMEYGREIPTISAEVIQKQNANNASDILHARVSGVWATKTSGAPGDHEKIRIRGQNSFFSSAEPLYVVDGVPVPIVNMSSLGIADLNIHDIENVTILKDASSAALYGFQGGNGVVLIDTKKGGESQFNFSAKYGYQWFDNYYDLMSTKDQLAAIDSAWNLKVSTMDFAFPEYSDTLCNHNRQDEIFSPGSVQEYQLSQAGRIGLMKYYISGNYMNHKGIINSMGYKRYTFSTRLGWLFWKRLAIEISYRGSSQDNKNNQEEYGGNSLIFYGISQSPCLECTPDSLFYNQYGISIPRSLDPNYALGNSLTPDDIIKANTNKLGINTHAVSGFARLHLTEHLNIDVMESFMSRNSEYENIMELRDIKVQSNEDVILFNHQVNLSYYNNFGKHNIGLVLANRFYKDNLWWQVDTLEGYLPEHYILKNSMAAYGLHGSVLRNMISYIGHLSYDYDKIWFVSVIANVSKIKEGIHINYYNLFPSLALSWDIARLKPLRGNRWINNLNLFVNWGTSGNYPLNGLANDLYKEIEYSDRTDAGQKYPYIDQFANHKLKHENTTETDYGIKTSFLNRRFSPGIVYYNKKIDNLIMQREIPAYYGGGIMFYNIGQIEVKGIDLNIEVTPVKKHNFQWDLIFNYSKSKQKVVKLLDGKDLAFLSYDALFPDFYVKEEEPLGNIYGYKYFGKWTKADKASENKLYAQKNGIKYLNADSSDLFINENDKVVIGNSIPDYTWNLTNSFQYRNFTADFTWYAAWGLQKYNATKAATYMTVVNREINSFIADTLNGIKNDAFYESSVFIDNASFIRLKSLTFSYEPSKKLLNKISYLFSLSFENLITITKFKGYDPEATIFTDNNFSDNSIDRGSVPNPKAVYVSISLKF
jgi:TonB-dependent starch-binding outer membrane protein SusC